MTQLTKYLKILLNLFIFAITIYCIIYIAPKFITFFRPFVIGLIIALIANPLVKYFEKKLNISRKIGSFITIVVVLALLITSVYFAILIIINQGLKFLEDLPELYNTFQNEFAVAINKIQLFSKNLPIELQHSIAIKTNEMTTYVENIMQKVGDPTIEKMSFIAKNLPQMIINFFIAMLSSYFFIDQHNFILAGVKKFTSRGVQERVIFVLQDFKKIIIDFLKARLKIVFVLYFILVVGLMVLRVKGAIFIAIAIALLDFLPIVGIGTVVLPWAILKFLSGDIHFTIGLIVLYIITQIIRQIIQPKIVGDSMGINPLAALILIYMGYKISNFGGMILAIPIGMLLYNCIKAGVFDTQIRCIRELVNDINQFRKF